MDERDYIELNKDIRVNKVIPGRTLTEYQQEYRQSNKEEIAKRRKKFYQANKEAIANHKKEFYDKHRDSILAKNNEKIECACGGRYTSANKNKHIQSKKHLAFLESQH